jgi:hypothetical protein
MSHYAQLEGFSFFKAKCSLNYLHQNHNGSMAGCRPPGQLNGILVDYGLHQLPSPGGLSMVELRLSMEDWGGGAQAVYGHDQWWSGTKQIILPGPPC